MSDDVPEQEYKPNQWIRYSYGNSGQGVSQIRGASYTKNNGWMYSVDNPMSPNDTMYVKEDQIIEEVESA